MSPRSPKKGALGSPAEKIRAMVEDPIGARDIVRMFRRSTSKRNWRAWCAFARGSTVQEIAALERVSVKAVRLRIILARRAFAALLRRMRARARGARR